MDLVIYHNADMDGIFCREIAKKALGDKATYLGWNYGQPLVGVPDSGFIYILDLSPDCLYHYSTCSKLVFETEIQHRLIWIDHHATAIAKWSKEIPGYRIDGVAACRLAWQYFSNFDLSKTQGTSQLPTKQQFVDRQVREPLAVQLVGEYDVWDKRNSDVDVFQFGLRSEDLDFDRLLSRVVFDSSEEARRLIKLGAAAKSYVDRDNAEIIKSRGFTVSWEGLTWLCLNSAKCNSLTFQAGIRPEHDGLLGFYCNGKCWTISLYGVPGKPDLDLSKIAIKYGGGGHKQACGFTTDKVDFLLPRKPPVWAND